MFKAPEQRGRLGAGTRREVEAGGKKGERRSWKMNELRFCECFVMSNNLLILVGVRKWLAQFVGDARGGCEQGGAGGGWRRVDKWGNVDKCVDKCLGLSRDVGLWAGRRIGAGRFWTGRGSCAHFLCRA